jgi:hypothetical protein
MPDARSDRSLTPANIAQEVKYVTAEGRGSFERPYGLAVAAPTRGGTEGVGRSAGAAVARDFAALEQAVTARISTWLPKLAHPIRTGEHNNTAFGIGLMLDYARITGKHGVRQLVESRARDYYLKDQACPINYEPSGEDFLSPCWPRRTRCAAFSRSRVRQNG